MDTTSEENTQDVAETAVEETPVETAAPAAAAAPSPAPEAKVAHTKERVGRVSSAKMHKTITVSVETLKPHPIYKKGMKWTTKFKAHDEENTCNEGDLVRIEETRPLSKTKRWQLVEIIERAV